MKGKKVRIFLGMLLAMVMLTSCWGGVVFAEGPVLSGIIRTPDDGPFIPSEDLYVFINLEGDNFHAGTGPNADGSFTFNDNIPDGNYTLWVDILGNNNPYAAPDRMNININSSENLYLNIKLQEPVVMGWVLNPDGSHFTPGDNKWCNVNLTDLSGQNTIAFIGNTENDGRFKLGGVAEGDYLLQVGANGGNNPYSDSLPVQIHVTSGQVTNQDVFLTIPPVQGNILAPDGSVFIPNGNNEGVWIGLAPVGDENNFIGSDWLQNNSNGFYRVSLNREILQEGDYVLFAHAWRLNTEDTQPFMVSDNVTVHLRPNETINVDLQLRYNDGYLGKIIPVLTTDASKYIRGDNVQVTLKQTGVQPNYKTNSVTYEIEYDGDTFELLNNDVDTAVVNGYIPFNTKMDIGEGADKKIVLTYIDMNNDIPLQEGATVFTANFKVKDNSPIGSKAFTLKPVTMLDSNGRVYNINDDNPVVRTVEVTDAAFVEGTVSLYLGDIGTGLNDTIVESLNQAKINSTMANLKFMLKHNAEDMGTVLNGWDAFIRDEKGDLGTIDSNGKVTGRFRVFTNDTANTMLRIDDAGYVKNEINIALNPGQACMVNTIVMYPGDIGQIANRQLLTTPEGKITNADFSAWLKLYKNNIGGTISPEDMLRTDFTKDGTIDNVDFSLWFASYKKLLTMAQ